MLVLGDVFAVVAVLVGVFLTTTLTLLTIGVGLREATEEVADRVGTKAGPRMIQGIFIGLPALLVSIMMASSPIGLVKVIGVVALFAWVMLALIGVAGIARFMARKLAADRQETARFSDFAATTAMLTGAFLFPFVGWWILAPFCAVFGFGLMLPQRKTQLAPEV